MACITLGRLRRRPHALLHRDSPYVSTVQLHYMRRSLTSCIAINTTLPPSELVADAVKRSTVAHLFHMYDLLCDIAAIPRKPPSTWVSIPQAKSGSGSVGKPPIPTLSSQPPPGKLGDTTRSLKLFRGGGVVEMDARTLARECLKVIGKELGVSR